MTTDEYSFNDAPISCLKYDGLGEIPNDGRYSFGEDGKMSWSALNDADLSNEAKQWVQLADMPYYVNGNEMKRISPGTFPRFENLAILTYATKWTVDADTEETIGDTFDLPNEFSNIDADKKHIFGILHQNGSILNFKKDADVFKIWVADGQTKIKNYSEPTYTKTDFKDYALPKTVFVVLQGCGGSGAGANQFVGGDGGGGGGGAFALIAVPVNDGITYSLELGKYAIGGAPRSSGTSGGGASLLINGSWVCKANGGCAGIHAQCSEADGGTVYLNGNGTKFYLLSHIDGAKGGADGKTGSYGVNRSSWRILNLSNDAENAFNTNAHNGGARSAGDKFSGPGGASAFADGGDSGGNFAEHCQGKNGRWGSGGGGARYCFGGITIGGSGGGGFAAVLW